MEDQTQPTEHPISQILEVPVSPSKSNRSLILIFVVISILLAAISVFAGIKIGKSQIANQQPVVTQPVATQPTSSPTVITDQPVSTATSSSTTNMAEEWKTYTNTVHNYSVKYPANWSIDTSEADNVEMYQDSDCCNTASVTISKGQVAWTFTINQLYTGFGAPDECQTGPDQCSSENKPMKVLGYQVDRSAVRATDSNKIIEAHMITRTPQNTHPGFGQIGFSNQFVVEDKIKYFLGYSGSEIEENLAILDAISASLEKR